jgi:phenylacetate-CoA ligase
MASLGSKIYALAPVPVQHVLVSIYGWRLRQARLGGCFQAEASAFREREWWTRAQWEDYVTLHLRELLLTSFRRAPHYRETWQVRGWTEQALAALTLDELPRLPALEKSTARDAPHTLLPDGRPARRHYTLPTSGSTGTPIATYWLPEERQRALALREARALKFAGVSFSLPRATFGGRLVVPDPDSQGPYHRFNWFEKQVYLSAFHLRPEAAPLYVDALRRHRTRWMTGYSHSIYQLARFILEQGLDAPRLDAVITTSEKVTEEMRGVIERAFRTRVYEEYGAVENVVFACECEHGRLHISPDAGILEVVDADLKPVPPGTPGEVLATGFIRPSQPYIRYRIGDQAILDDQPCPCGREMPVLRSVIGRIEDTIYGPDGRRMLRFHGIFTDQPHIREGQIIQERLDHIRVRVVPGVGFGPADGDEIAARVRQRLGDRVSVTVEAVDQIERTQAGKFRAVVSLLPEDEIAQLEELHRQASAGGKDD